jgi:excisionase family DNA binding protein
VIPTPEQRPTLTVEEAGAFLGLGRSGAYEAVRRGEIPSISFGRRIVVPTAALRRLLSLDIPTRRTSAE